jgi:CheY-like chemotaxis protein
MAEAGGVASPLVLVVEDHTDTLEMMGVVLNLHGFEVTLARTAEEALAALAERPPAVITVDVGLPGICGLELARRVRQHPTARTVPMIAVTGWAAQRDVERAKEAGCDVVLPKPVALETLLTEIQRLLSMEQAGQSDENKRVRAE